MRDVAMSPSSQCMTNPVDPFAGGRLALGLAIIDMTSPRGPIFG